MGAGRGKTVDRVIVGLEDDDGNVIAHIDMDSSLIEKMQRDYEEGLLDYFWGDEELSNYLENSGIKVAYGWGLSDAGDLELNIEGVGQVRISKVDPDLGYFMYTAVATADKIQTSYQRATGSENKVIEYVLFDTSSSNYELSGGTKGVATKLRGTDYDTTYITLEASKSSRLPRDQLYSLKREGNFDFSSPDTIVPVLTERRGSQNGWFSSSGSYSKTTVTHEMGHAVMNSLSSSKGSNFSKKQIQDWHERTYNSPVSGYAQKNANESFAECFSLYVAGGESKSKMYSEFKGMMRDYGLESMYGCAR